ncbi:MAG: aminotransferase class I/II-fold pyridoxal phosphate-dependent enzyme [Anaerolineaceae bacterium]|nr:aminotransferase class I/II-fold pyridoxal phosphate-dependent enzyme [Anaerolineaceae bacterium]
MRPIQPRHGISTLVNHVGEGSDPLLSHVNPIYQTSTFYFPDVATGAALFKGEQPGYIYSRLSNPNTDQLAAKIAALEGLDLLRAQPDRPAEEVVAGQVLASGMAAITTAILARVKGGQTIIAQGLLYSATYNFLHEFATQYGIQLVWLDDCSPQSWQAAFEKAPQAVLAYAETPVNPSMAIVDLAAVAEIAHRHQAWLMVDNTFATPYCQRPLTLGADVVVHSTTKYLSGHGLIIGGAVVSRHVDFIHNPLHNTLILLGGCASPFDAWLTNNGLKTFELRMERHCQNAMQVASFLENHPKVARVDYPGLESHPDAALARRQMAAFGGMMSFELKGGFSAGVALMEHVQVCVLAVSLGNLDTLICHPASMTHVTVSAETRQAMGISDGQVRLSVGIENIEDVLEDFEQGLRCCD